ncbi:MAG: alkaline phosphatase family protein [Phycisphaerae bacterium]
MHTFIRQTGRRGWAAFLLAAVLLSAGGCVPEPHKPQGTFNLDFSLPSGSETSGAIVFLVDGVNTEVFNEMLENGELPAIRYYFIDRGLYCPRTMVNTPSVTLANETSVVTGVFPGHHNITGINWFDRNRLIWRDYETIAQKNTLDGDYGNKTIYQHFPHRTTFSLFYQAHKGTTKFVENWTSAGPPFFFGWYEFVDRLTLSRFDLLMEVARTRREFPAFTMVYQLAPDFRAYGYGVSDQRYRAAMKHTDTQIGRVLADVERAGLLEKLHLVLLSDHSLMDVKKHAPVDKTLRELGLKVSDARLWEKTPFEERMEVYRRSNCVLYGSGDRYWAIQLRKPHRIRPHKMDRADKEPRFHPWPVRPNAEDLTVYPLPGDRVENIPAYLLTRHDGVDAVAVTTGKDKAVLMRKAGAVEFHQPGGPGKPVYYRLIRGDDPLGYAGHVPAEVLAGNRPLTPRRWLELTNDTQFPDVPPQLVAYFRAERAGDIVLFAAPGWDFGTRNRAGHGGLRPGDVHVPMAIAGPGVPKGKRIDAARTVDLVPTILTLIGKDVPAGLDGQSLVGAADK